MHIQTKTTRFNKKKIWKKDERTHHNLLNTTQKSKDSAIKNPLKHAESTGIPEG